MKKNVKKLVLHKETVRDLQQSGLKEAAGGSQSNCPSCESCAPTGCIMSCLAECGV